MNNELRRLIRKNDKTRQYLDGWNVNPEEFSLFEIIPDDPPVIDVDPISSERTDANEKRT